MTEAAPSVDGAVTAVSAATAPSEPETSEAAAIRALVLGCAGVAGMSAGALDELRAYLPGRSVTGVQVEDDEVTVSIVARYGHPLGEVAARIGEVLAPLLVGRRLQVTVDDILLPGESLGDDGA